MGYQPPPLRALLEHVKRVFEASARLAIREGANGAIHDAIRFDHLRPVGTRIEFRSLLTGRSAVICRASDECPTASRIFRG